MTTEAQLWFMEETRFSRVSLTSISSLSATAHTSKSWQNHADNDDGGRGGTFRSCRAKNSSYEDNKKKGTPTIAWKMSGGIYRRRKMNVLSFRTGSEEEEKNVF